MARDRVLVTRIQLRWFLATVAAGLGSGASMWALHLMTGLPEHPGRWFLVWVALAPVALVASRWSRSDRASAGALVHSASISGAALVVVGVYLVLVVGINGSPSGSERDLMLSSLFAALVAALLVPPVRARVAESVRSVLHQEKPSTGDVVSAFGTRMSRSVPMDELMLQLAESLRETVPGTRAEIWTGTADALRRTTSVPTLPPATLRVSGAEATTVARARIGGPAWVSVWLPSLVPEEPHGDFRVVPVAHLGELHGLLVVVRPPGSEDFADADDDALVELAHQLGLALHNVQLDSALQASLEELAERNEELQASRLRIVTASDAARRGIERNLHDGAQQHLVALAVKIGLVAGIAEDGDAALVGQMLGDLRKDVQATIDEVRALAHGIYPPLLRDRGLGEALRTAANRAALPCRVEVDLPGRYPETVESAAYFCSTEALQNAGKYAGDGATVTLTVRGGDGQVIVEIADDGPGFDPAEHAEGHGFTNMRDRLGAIGGTLDLRSAPGEGTRLVLTIPAEPLPAEVPA
ncbi:MAG TPA: ATP-binding protein [Nocardioides sp.]|nr:ATP-binding protein [Nocardioides sp.]